MKQDCYDLDSSEDLPDVFTLSSPAIHKKKVELSTDDVSPVPPADDSFLIDQAIMDEEPGTSPLERKDSGPTPEVPEGNVAVRSDQPESKEPQPSNDQSCRPLRQCCPLVRLAYDSLGRLQNHMPYLCSLQASQPLQPGPVMQQSPFNGHTHMNFHRGYLPLLLLPFPWQYRYHASPRPIMCDFISLLQYNYLFPYPHSYSRGMVW